MIDPVAVAGCAALGALGGALVPRLVAAIAEPAPETAEKAETAETAVPPKERYRDIAALPGLAWKASLAAGASGGILGLSVGWSWALLFLLPLVPVSVALAVVDWRTQLLPTWVIAPTYVVVAVLVLVCWVLTRDTDDLVRAGAGWLIAGGSFFVLWFIHPRGLGYGDVRLSGILGIALGYLGWSELLVGLYAGFLLGGLGGGLLSALRVVDRRSFPFGPFMLVGALAGVAVGERIVDGLVLR